jgi:DNA-binding transcriptional LysR family regulator
LIHHPSKDVNLNQLNLNQLRVFELVFRTASMTHAARDLHLTQSGVSQHIKSLEDVLGVTLFDRIEQRLVPTSAARALYEHCSRAMTQLEQDLEQVVARPGSRGALELTGEIRIGMPVEFGNNLVMPRLAKFARLHPRVNFRLRLGWAARVNEELLRGNLDFGFVDDYRMDSRIATERVYDEVLELCMAEAAAARLAQPIAALKPSDPVAQARFFESLEYVEYAENEPVLRLWFAHHLGAKASRGMHLNVRATVLDVQGVARFIAHEGGAGILPAYLIPSSPGGKGLYRFKGRGKPFVNRISAAWLRDRTHSPASQALLSFLKDSLPKSV